MPSNKEVIVIGIREDMETGKRESHIRMRYCEHKTVMKKQRLLTINTTTL